MKRTVGAAALAAGSVVAGGVALATLAPHPPAEVTPTVPGAVVIPAPALADLCRPGYTDTVRPSSSFTTPLKIRQLHDLRAVDQDPAHYEEDHLVSLELGGAPANPANLWPEPWPDAHRKDALENRLHRDVCAGKLGLVEAQARIRRWGR